jgi:GT2 family glycosyltransferase
MKTVAVVVVNWNGRPYLDKCLSSLHAQTYPGLEIILMDNGSTDGSAEFVAAHFPQVRLIRHTSNLGFAAANNIAIRNTTAAYIATLNNDAWAEPTWVAELVKVAESDHRVGMAASKMLFAAQPTMINSAGIALDRAGIAWDWRGGEPDDEDTRPVEVFGPCAGAALYQRTMLDDVGLLDEDFFAYLEDVDLAWRARLRGWRCLYVPTARVYHWHSATSTEGSPFKNRLLGRNKLWAILKNYPSPQLWWFLPVIAAYDLAAIVYALLVRGEVSALQGRLAALWSLPVVLRKRHQIQQSRSVTFTELAQHLHHLASPWEVIKRYQHLKTSTGMLAPRDRQDKV